MLEPSKGWKSFGWNVIEVDGHNFSDILLELRKIPINKNQPHVIIAHTTKGKGISLMENQIDWHHRIPSEKEYLQALDELNDQKEALR